MRISDVAIDRPVFTIMMTLAAMTLGILGISRMGIELFPDVTLPMATVMTLYPGASPEEVEQQVSRVIEEAVSGIAGLEKVQSISRDSVSAVLVQFKSSADVRQAVSDVRDRVAMARPRFPTDVRDPVISRVDPSAAPIVVYAVDSPTRSSLEIRLLVEDVVRPAMEKIDGVGGLNVLGGDEREIQVQLRRADLDALRLTALQVAQAIGTDSRDIPGGHVTSGARELTLKAVGRFKSPQEVGEVVVLAHPNGTQVRVRDVAHVVDTIKEPRTLTRVNGKPSVTIEVEKQSGTNTVATADAVEKAIQQLRERLPRDITITRIIDASRFIRANAQQLWSALIEGAIFAILVIFLFMLDWRSTFISALALPTSVVATFFVLWMFGYSLNIMTMMGLSLAIGFLIDDSVVVRENIFRHMEHGADPVTAARKGTAEIALAVMATTFTVVAVFVPVAFTGGMIGGMFRQFGITIAAAAIISLIVSFTLDPMLSARLTQSVPADRHERMLRHWFYGPVLRVLDSLDATYRVVLGWSLRHPFLVLGFAVLLFVGSLRLMTLMGQEGMPRADQGDVSVNIELTPGTSLMETNRVTQQVEAVLRTVPEVVNISTTVGPDEDVSKARIRVNAVAKNERKRSLDEIMDWLRPRLDAIPGLSYYMREAGLGGSAENVLLASPIVVQILGPDYAELKRLSDLAWDAVRSSPGTRDLAFSFRPGSPEQMLVVDRTKAADHGVSFLQAALTLRNAVQGEAVAKYRDGVHDVDVRVQLQPSDRASVADIQQVRVPSWKGAPVPLADVTTLQQSATPGTIERINRQRMVSVTAGASARSLGEVLNEIRVKMDVIQMQEGYSYKFTGENEFMEDTFNNLGLALVLAILFIYFVLASQFESIIHPFTIMFSLPLAVVGALLGLFLTGSAMGMTGMVGIILLMGLATKNGILLVDFANQQRALGKTAVEALEMAGPTRLRPILMTSAAMVLGMLPAAMGKGEGSEFRSPMAVAVIGGVITSTFLTLLVVPVVYTWLDRFTPRGRRDRKAKRTNGKREHSTPVVASVVE